MSAGVAARQVVDLTTRMMRLSLFIRIGTPTIIIQRRKAEREPAAAVMLMRMGGFYIASLARPLISRNSPTSHSINPPGGVQRMRCLSTIEKGDDPVIDPLHLLYTSAGIYVVMMT